MKNAVRVTFVVNKNKEPELEIALKSRKYVMSGDLWLLAKVVMLSNSQVRQGIVAAAEYLCERAHFKYGEHVDRPKAISAVKEAVNKVMLSQLNAATKTDRVTIEF